jgi:hypothetical protein
MKHRGAIFAALAATFLVIPLIFGLSASAASTATPSVADAVAHYLQARADAAMENGDVSILTACFTPTSPAAAVEQYMAAGYRAFHEQMGDFPASSTVNVRGESVAVNGDTATVTVTAETDISFSKESQRSCDEGEVLTHTIGLSLVNGVWLVNSDAYQEDGAVAYLKAARAPSNLVVAAQSAQQTAVAAAVAQQAAEFAVASPLPGPVADSSEANPLYITTFTYQRSAAVSYANRWWDSYNSYYNNYNGPGYGGDCANFVSQCVGDSAGGALWMFGSSSDPVGQQWWFHHSTMTQSQSWTYCPTQIAAWRWAQPGRGPASYIVAYSRSKPSGYSTGDVAWLVDSSGVAYHALICTSFSGSTPLFSCHSYPQHNKPLSYWGAPSVRYGELVNTVTVY